MIVGSGRGWLAGALALALAGCGGNGGSSGAGPGMGSPAPSPSPPPPGGLYAPPAAESLSAADVERVLAQAVGEARARRLPATLAVTDRLGNVLAVFAMTGAPATTTVSRRQIGGIAAPGQEAGLQGAVVPAPAAAIAKAITGAYLSSSGNAFSTRTASQIVQQHFPPAPNALGLESGPLFGVQFSQLPCSDLVTRAGEGLIGPKRSPLGLAADPGGFPLYKNGVVVGGIGVVADGDYGFDPDILDRDADGEEAVALAGAQGFLPPAEIIADRITVDGTSLRFSDASASDLAPLQSAFDPNSGSFVAVAGYGGGAIAAGAVYGSEASGVRPARAGEFASPDAWVLSDGAGNARFPIRAGTDAASTPVPLTAAEARALLEAAFAVLSRARAQIRRPLDSRMQATISLVDSHGAVLGLVRSPDAPLFGADVSLQKARSAAFFSSPVAGGQLAVTPGAGDYLQRLRTLLGEAGALAGGTAFTTRSIGNLARPYLPDGEVGALAGPLALGDPARFSPFATGLQLELVAPNLLQHLAHVTSGGAQADTPRGCTLLPPAPGGAPRLANGLQIFPGSVPIYRGDRLVGAIGVSGDGIDQDDMVSFLGVHEAGAAAGNAAAPMRADRIVVAVGAGVRLRYVACPFAPFLGDTRQNVCQGL